MSVISPTTAAGVNGAVICAMSQNDTQSNPHNPMYGIAMAGRTGQLLTLIGTDSSVSGGNSMAPMELINPAWQPTVIAQPSDATALVPLPPGGAPDPLTVATIESQTRMLWTATSATLQEGRLLGRWSSSGVRRRMCSVSSSSSGFSRARLRRGSITPIAQHLPPCEYTTSRHGTDEEARDA